MDNKGSFTLRRKTFLAVGGVNPVRIIEKKYDGTEATLMEFEFIPLAIPEKFATEYDLREK